MEYFEKNLQHTVTLKIEEDLFLGSLITGNTKFMIALRHLYALVGRLEKGDEVTITFKKKKEYKG